MYRGSKYQQNAKHSHTSLTNVHKGSLVKHNVRTTLLKYGSKGPALINSYGEADDAFQENNQSICDQKDEEPVKGTLYEREVNRLLDTLGPRFVDWWWDTPLPVDADLLPEFVPGFQTPFRQCPPGVRPTLADEELTYLRKLARPLPTHFALGEYAFSYQMHFLLSIQVNCYLCCDFIRTLSGKHLCCLYPFCLIHTSQSMCVFLNGKYSRGYPHCKFY